MPSTNDLRRMVDRATADPGTLLKRLLVLHDDAITVKEREAAPFITKGELPAKFTSDLINLSKSMDSLTMSYARYTKSQDDWANSLNPEQKLAGLHDWVLKVYRDQPELVAAWVKRLVGALNEASDDAARIRATLDDEDAHLPGGQAWIRRQFAPTAAAAATPAE